MNLYVILATVVMLFASGFGLGIKFEKSKWQEREYSELILANEKLAKISHQYRLLERMHTKELFAIADKYQKELSDAKTKHQRDIAAVESGALRLLDPARREGTAGNRGTETSSTTGRSNGGAHAELSREAASFLFGLTSEADQVAIQLKACQQVILTDRSMTD